MEHLKLPICFELSSKLRGVTSRMSLVDAMEEVAEVLQASVYTAQYFNTGGHGMSSYSVHNVPRGLLDCFNCQTSAKADPVMQHLRVSPSPIIWGRETYALAGNKDWEALADFGMRKGVSLALHLDDHRHFVVGLCWRDESRQPFDDGRTLHGVIQTLAVFAEPVVHRLWLLDQRASLGAMLTEREQECLRWICRGLSDDLIASAMGISYRGVRKHVESVISKLGSVNRTEAAVTATRTGFAF